MRQTENGKSIADITKHQGQTMNGHNGFINTEYAKLVSNQERFKSVNPRDQSYYLPRESNPYVDYAPNSSNSTFQQNMNIYPNDYQREAKNNSYVHQTPDRRIESRRHRISNKHKSIDHSEKLQSQDALRYKNSFESNLHWDNGAATQVDQRRLISEEYKDRKTSIKQLHNQFFAEQLRQQNINKQFDNDNRQIDDWNTVQQEGINDTLIKNYKKYNQNKYLKLNRTQNHEPNGFLKYQELVNNMPTEDDAPQYNDPAVKYFKMNQNNNLIIQRGIPKIALNKESNGIINKHFLYPLCNSPKRKQCYNEIARDYKDDLIKQINLKRDSKNLENTENKLKAETTIMNPYNEDFDRMHRQFTKYLTNESVIKSNINIKDFVGDPFKRKDPRLDMSPLFKVTKKSALNAYNLNGNEIDNNTIHYKDYHTLNNSVLPGTNSLLNLNQKNENNGSLLRLKSRDERLRHFSRNASTRARLAKTIDRECMDTIKTLNLRDVNNKRKGTNIITDKNTIKSPSINEERFKNTDFREKNISKSVAKLQFTPNKNHNDFKNKNESKQKNPYQSKAAPRNCHQKLTTMNIQMLK